ncbi:hypothetical protein G7Y89_g4882 [Cudoniella acicularis]|uniref:Phenylalanine ammonia-lyase n=1 Tax=Cudoniella acicularis TaxID=354080 RepID=A0A8H4W4A5_9HELO|nr:hypothetical protein G7Y89_g4882 [Cudoniella acicularis]
MALGSINDILLSHWRDVAAKLKGTLPDQEINGNDLDLATVVAVARYGTPVQLAKSSIDATIQTAEMVQSSLDRGMVIYGVNTGFGGSADTRTEAVEELQKNLLRMLQFGVTLEEKPVIHNFGKKNDLALGQIISQCALPLDDPVSATSMPESWVRASMLIRLNSLASGFSGVRESTIRTLHQILEAGVTPQVPIKGSISASGDLSPLSYIGGVVQGKPGLNVWTRDTTGRRSLKRADIALAEKSIAPSTLGAKEGLALVNGTAVSAAVGSLALHDALGQAALSQVLTAMSVEALCGTDESFHPFFGEVRPHPGQIESAQNIFAFLSGSSLTQHGNNAEEGELRQDRYSIRTASQWIGPVLEDLHLAHQQLTIEMNSTTDNPLVDPHQGGRMMHGGNFQARAVTSAMEKTRQSLQTIGRMLFAQCTELINPMTNRGLPPNLAAGEPSECFIWKGTDIMIAALQAELGFLANPVGNHVQTAEMGNQAINSLALISARYTLEAVQTLSQLAAAHLVALCQALDLRAMQIRFLEALEPIFRGIADESFSSYLQDVEAMDAFRTSLWVLFQKSLDQLTSFDSPKRFSSAVGSLQPLVLKHIVPTETSIAALYSWTEQCSSRSLEIFRMNRKMYLSNPDATSYIGNASRRMYQFIRHDLGVPFVDNNTISTPKNEESGFNWGAEGMQQDAARGQTMGGMISKVFESIRSGELYHVVMDCISDVQPKIKVVEESLAQTSDTQEALDGDSIERSESQSPDSVSVSVAEGIQLFTPAQTWSSRSTSVMDLEVGKDCNEDVKHEDVTRRKEMNR